MPPQDTVKALVRVALLVGIEAVLTAPVSGCHPNRSNLSPEDEMPRLTIEEVQEAYTEEWMGLQGVVGIGIGLCEGEPCIRVFLSQGSTEAEEAIPQAVGGYQLSWR